MTLFPDRAGVSINPPTRVVVVGVEATVIEGRTLPARVVRFGDDLAIRYLAEWELQAARLTPAFWIYAQPPGAFDRRILFETLGGAMVEQDDTGCIWRDDERLGPGSLIAFGTPARDRDGDFVLGERAALLMGRQDATGWQLRVELTGPVLWQFEAPRPLRSWWPRGWMRLALTRRADRCESLR